MNYSNFISKENISTLWEVISDEDVFKFLSKDKQNNIYEIFIDNIKGFFDVEKKNINNLIDMNKKYIVLILSYINKNYPTQLNKIKILENPNLKEENELITYEEIQNDKKSKFELDLIKKEEEFMEAITLKVPPVPNFTDNFVDEPIDEMEQKIKEMTEKRKYDIEIINRNYEKNNNQLNFLQSQETSIKNEKFKHKENNLTKNVSWGVNEEFEINSTNETLKEIDENINETLKETYEITNEITNETFKKTDKNINEINLFSKLKKKVDNQNIKEDRIKNIEENITELNKKVDIIIDLFYKNNLIKN